MKHVLLVMVGVFALLLAGNASITWWHEKGHAVTCEALGGEASIVMAWHGQGGVTYCYGLSDEKMAVFRERTAVQEAVGYQIRAFWLFLCYLVSFVTFVSGFAFKRFKEETEKRHDAQKSKRIAIGNTTR